MTETTTTQNENQDTQNQNTENQDSGTGIVQQIRQRLASHLQQNWQQNGQQEWPITWQNMPAPTNLQSQTTQGWLHFNVILESIKPLDLGAAHRMVSGRIEITSTAPKDTGMENIDNITDRVLELFATQNIDTIRIGKINIKPPRDEGGHILAEINIKFNTITTLANTNLATTTLATS